MDTSTPLEERVFAGLLIAFVCLLGAMVWFGRAIFVAVRNPSTLEGRGDQIFATVTFYALLIDTTWAVAILLWTAYDALLAPPSVLPAVASSANTRREVILYFVYYTVLIGPALLLSFFYWRGRGLPVPIVKPPEAAE